VAIQIASSEFSLKREIKRITLLFFVCFSSCWAIVKLVWQGHKTTGDVIKDFIA